MYIFQIRSRWTSSSLGIKVGDLVFLRENQTTPLHFKLGRVTEVFPGRDQKVRVVSILTQNEEFRRPISRLSLLKPVPSGTGGCSIFYKRFVFT